MAGCDLLANVRGRRGTSDLGPSVKLGHYRVWLPVAEDAWRIYAHPNPGADYMDERAFEELKAKVEQLERELRGAITFLEGTNKGLADAVRREARKHGRFQSLLAP